jgi:phosphoribosylformimino-5-aminoimidazole carboxamide ribotide isomerase
MLLLPAIDLRGGRCVRLLRGSFADATRYSEDPVAVARGYADAGARWIHVVDLDAAEGRGEDNLPVIERLRRAVSCRVEAGGGVRSVDQAQRLLSLGVDRLILGTVLVRAPREAASMAARLGPRFAAGVDARDGMIRVAGWTAEEGGADTELAAGLAGLGMRWMVYTNISRDGTLEGPDVARTNAAARAAGLPTVLSGGIGSEDDVRRVAEESDPLVVGVILGRALYESRVDLPSLVSRYRQEESAWDPPGS